MGISDTMLDDIMHNCRVKTYPSGRTEIIAAPGACFRETGWELSDKWDIDETSKDDIPSLTAEENNIRARRRARSAVHDLAFSNDFDRFVTFTLDSTHIDRYDVVEITKKLNTWLDNRVRRHGLHYVLIPELHVDGAVHFHGLVNSSAFAEVDSGTLSKGGKPLKPRSKAQRQKMLDDGYHVVYNLPAWSLGFSTAIALYGDRAAAIAYVCKYIAKTTEKVGGRWYYSGGALLHPSVKLVDIDYQDFCDFCPDGVWTTPDGGSFCSCVI